jgi:hypothetical protein
MGASLRAQSIDAGTRFDNSTLFETSEYSVAATYCTEVHCCAASCDRIGSMPSDRSGNSCTAIQRKYGPKRPVC